MAVISILNCRGAWMVWSLWCGERSGRELGGSWECARRRRGLDTGGETSGDEILTLRISVGSDTLVRIDSC